MSVANRSTFQTGSSWSVMSSTSTSDVIVLALGVTLAAAYLFRDQLFSSKSKAAPTISHPNKTNGGTNPRDFVSQMKEGVGLLCLLSCHLSPDTLFPRKSAW